MGITLYAITHSPTCNTKDGDRQEMAIGIGRGSQGFAGIEQVQGQEDPLSGDGRVDAPITSPGHETPLASGVSTNVSVDVHTRQHDSEADVDA
eukprot:scaffold4232_cov215-Amphora_coffeaeformis.AAC.14